MKFVLLPSTTITVNGGARRAPLPRLLACRPGTVPLGRQGRLGRDVRWMSSMYEAHEEAQTRGRESKRTNQTPSPVLSRQVDLRASRLGNTRDGAKKFEALGLDKTFVKAIMGAFPNVKEPTRVQEELIAALVKGEKDILLKDEPGSGKTFGIVLGLLGKPRRVMLDTETGKKRRVVTTVFLVPHRDLAVQMMGWIERLVQELEGDAPEMDSIAQMLARGKGWDCKEAVEQLRETAPHIVVCTPQALMEVWKSDGEVLGLDTLSGVVVDEVDYVVPMGEKKGRQQHLHEGETATVLEKIYGRRRRMREKGVVETEENMPQLVLGSATLRVHFLKYLFGETGWMNRHKTVKIRGNGVEKTGQVLHSILVAWGDGVANADTDADAANHVESFDERSAVEAIAAALLDDSSVSSALVVIRSSSSVRRVVDGLGRFGIEAAGLDLTRGRTSVERVLVGTAATTRGMDIGSLSHVFVVGVAEGRAVEAYRHIAGRVGRFGGSGRVVSVVGAADRERMGRVVSAVGAEVVRYELFD